MNSSRNKMDSIGVVVPTYNCGEYISECLESLLKQSYPPHQIVVCDDFSQDCTREVVLEYKRKYPKIIETVFNDKNYGIPQNFNGGLKRIRTKYVSIVAGDDFWHPDKLKLELKNIKKNPECRWAYSDSVLVDKDSNFLKPFRREHDGAQGDILFEVLTHKMTLRNWLIEKQLLDSIGLFDENLFIFEDWDFKIRLAAASHVKHVKHDSVFYRQHGEGISHSNGKIYYENLFNVFLKNRHLIDALPQKKKQVVIKNQRDNIALHINRYMKENCRFSIYKRLKFFMIKAVLNYQIR